MQYGEPTTSSVVKSGSARAEALDERPRSRARSRSRPGCAPRRPSARPRRTRAPRSRPTLRPGTSPRPIGAALAAAQLVEPDPGVDLVDEGMLDHGSAASATQCQTPGRATTPPVSRPRSPGGALRAARRATRRPRACPSPRACRASRCRGAASSTTFSSSSSSSGTAGSCSKTSSAAPAIVPARAPRRARARRRSAPRAVFTSTAVGRIAASAAASIRWRVSARRAGSGG